MLTAPDFLATLTGPTPCRMDPRLWDEDAPDASRAIARQLCAECPVRTACEQWALDRPAEDGTWGGLDDRDRRSIRARRAQLPVPPNLVCGTPEALQRHRRLSEVCTVCADAERARQLDRLASEEHGTAAMYHLETRLGVPHCRRCTGWSTARWAVRKAQGAPAGRSGVQAGSSPHGDATGAQTGVQRLGVAA